MLVAQGKLDEALKVYRDGFAIRERLAATDSSNTQWQRDLSVSYDDVGDVLVAHKNFPGFRRDFRAKMWGTSSPSDKLADDLGNAIESIRISGRRSDFFTAGKLAPGNLRLLQQYRHRAAKVCATSCPQAA